MENFTYFAASDIHGNIGALDEIIRLAEGKKADRLFIAGDLCPGDPAFALRLHNASFPYIAVKGNCDSLWDYRDSGLAVPKESVYFEMPDGRHIGMTHGHSIFSPDDFPFTLEKGDIFIQGHSHVPSLFKDDRGIIHLNPGSPSRPRSMDGATCAVIRKDEIGIHRIKDWKKIFSLSIH